MLQEMVDGNSPGPIAVTVHSLTTMMRTILTGFLARSQLHVAVDWGDLQLSYQYSTTAHIILT